MTSEDLDILDHAFIRMPCNACGQTYEVPLRDILLSHTLVRCGCPVHEETECPLIFQVRLFDREPIKVLSAVWEQLAARARPTGVNVYSGRVVRPLIATLQMDVKEVP